MSASEPLLRAAAFLTVLATMLLMERRRPLLPDPLGRARIRFANLTLAAVGMVLLRLFLPGAAIGAALWSAAHGAGLMAHLASMPAAVLGVLVLDFAVYLQHRAFHRIPWLWSLHAVHHSDQHLDATCGVRFHPGEILISMLWKCAVVIALAVPAPAVLAFEILLNAASLVTHSNLALEGATDLRLRRLLVTPAMHRWHHSTRLAESLTNFGFSLSLWDRLLRTYDGRETPREGLDVGLPGARPASCPAPGLRQMLFLKV